MTYYKSAYDTENYSKAYSEYRKEWVEKWILIVPLVVIVFCVAVSLLFKWANKVNLQGRVYKEKRTIKKISKDREYKNIAILYRTNAQSRK